LRRKECAIDRKGRSCECAVAPKSTQEYEKAEVRGKVWKEDWRGWNDPEGVRRTARGENIIGWAGEIRARATESLYHIGAYCQLKSKWFVCCGNKMSGNPEYAVK
jgi:hypothetical protein